MIEFVGGPLDGKTVATDDEEDFHPSATKWLIAGLLSRLDQQERMETKFSSLMKWRQPSPGIVETAKRENWSEKQKEAMMVWHEYDVTECKEANGLLLATARYRGADW